MVKRLVMTGCVLVVVSGAFGLGVANAKPKPARLQRIAAGDVPGRLRVDIDEAVEVRALDSQLPETSEPMVFLAIDSTVVRVLAARDHVGLYRITGARGVDYLVHVTQDGGPGTCVWSETTTVFRVSAVDHELVEVGTATTGGYLECSAAPRACGCGTWRSEMTVFSERGTTRLRLQPRARDSTAGSGRPPNATTLSF